MNLESFHLHKTAVPTSGDPETWARIVALAIFAGCAGVVVWQARSMSGGMPMPGGWTMPMMWMAMPGRSLWLAAWMFLGMWEVMMIAMMLPSSWPMLELYWRVARHAGSRWAGSLAAVVAIGYFLVWLGFGVLVFGAGVEILRAAMASEALSRWIPGSAGVVLILAGVYQFTPLKQACLRHCREPLILLGEHWRAGVWGALRLGLHHGAFCALCCWALMAMQAVLGLMNLAVMAAVAAVIAVEKLWSCGPLLARVAGAASILLGLAIVIRLL